MVDNSTPVQQHLHAAIADARAELRESWPALQQWDLLDDEGRASLHDQVSEAVRRICAFREAQRRLPATTACVCPACS